MTDPYGILTMSQFEEILKVVASKDAEIARLRLTAEEREAIEDAAGICEEHAEEYDGAVSSPIADTLRNLLERLK